MICLGLHEARALRDIEQRRGSATNVYGLAGPGKPVDGYLPLRSRRQNSSIRKKRVHKLRRGQRRGKRIHESRPLDERSYEGLLVRSQLLLPACLIDYDALANRTRVIYELIKRQRHRRAWHSPVRLSVEPFDQEAGLLEFNREKERRRHIVSLVGDARLIRTARSDLISPKIQACLIRFAIEKVVIVLAHKCLRIVNRVG